MLSLIPESRFRAKSTKPLSLPVRRAQIPSAAPPARTDVVLSYNDLVADERQSEQIAEGRSSRLNIVSRS